MAPRGWAPIRLGDVCIKIGSGATPRGGSGVYLRSGPYALIRSQNVHNDGFRRGGLAFIGEKHAAELSNVEVLREDVLLNITGDSVARCCLVDESILPARVNQHVSIVRPDSNRLAPQFLRYSLVSPAMQAQLLSWAGGGATRDALTKRMIESIEVLAPTNVDEQRAVVRILSTLDDKIELNRRMSETLEAIGRDIFQSWFVDFDPVRAKVDGRPIGLPAAIANLFPGGFADSELGEIPAGWQVRPISDLAEVVGGSTPSTSKSEYWQDGHHCWATPRDLAKLTTPVLLDTERHITEAGLTQISSGLLPPGSVLLSSRAPIGYLAIPEVPVAVNQGFIAMKPRVGVSNLFLLFWARSAHHEILSRANGSTFLEISKSNYRSIPVVSPPDHVFAAFDAMVRPLYQRIALNERESHTLASQRDTLLPKLFSGEIRIEIG